MFFLNGYTFFSQIYTNELHHIEFAWATTITNQISSIDLNLCEKGFSFLLLTRLWHDALVLFVVERLRCVFTL